MISNRPRSEWVNKRKIRAKDAVNTVWWFCRCPEPKADVTRVLAPYSERMKTLLKDPERFYRPKERPSGHEIAKAFGKENGGAIPSNLLQIPNTESNSAYLRSCKMLGRDSHPARFPSALPQFFIKFLTDPGDVVVDIFSGSNTTGHAAELLGRRWLSMELNREYAALSVVRFMGRWSDDEVRRTIARLDAGEVVEIDGVRLFFVGGPISLSGGGEAGGNWIRQGVVRSGGGSGGRRYFCRQRPMGDFRWSSRAS